MQTTTIPLRGTEYSVDAEALTAARLLTPDALRVMLALAKSKRDWRAEMIAECVGNERAAAERSARNRSAVHGYGPSRTAAQRYDNLHNEGGEGFNPHRNR